MIRRRIKLFFLSLLLLFVFYQIPFYHEWIYRRLVSPDISGDVWHEADHMAIEDRMALRFGISYMFYKDIVRDFDSVKQRVTILLPPREYVHEMEFPEMEIPEPSVFYYFTGVRAVNQSSPNVRQANWALEVTRGHIFIKAIRSSGHLDTLLALYKPYRHGA